jgi:signal transduction histidine kinase
MTRSDAIPPRTDEEWHGRLRAAARRVRPRGRSRSRSHLPARAVSPDALLAERTRIARELHDGVAQTLYAIALTASRGSTLLERGDRNQLQRLVDDVFRLANGGQVELRQLLAQLWSDELAPADLAEALTSLAVAVQARHGIQIRLALGQGPGVSSAVKHALLGIAREALHNVAKHAAADQVDVVLEVGAEIVLVVADDGLGFDQELARPGHFGLRSMRERAEAVGGTLDTISDLGRGTQVRVRIPRTPMKPSPGVE